MKVRLIFKNFITGLWGQVFLWVLLPLMLLVITFSFLVIDNHQVAMHTLALEDNAGLVRALAQIVSMRAISVSSNLSIPVNELSTDDLQLEQLLLDPHSQRNTSILLLNTDGTLLFSYGLTDPDDDFLRWPDVAQALSGKSGALRVSSSIQSDVIVYAPVNKTAWVLIMREYQRLQGISVIRLEQIIPIVLLTTIGISLMAVYFGFKKIAQPLKALEQYTHQIASDNFNTVAISVGGIREIEDLHQAINQMIKQIQKDQAAIRTYLGAVTRAQEHERTRLARELHDDTVQDLIALDHRVQRIQRTIKQSPNQASEHAVELRQMIDKAIRDVRRMCMDLRPLYLDELGLVGSLEMLAYKSNATFQAVGSPVRLQAEHEATLYRIAQEALSNAIHHAQAEQIHVEVQFTPDNIQLSIRDNGIGFVLHNDFETLVKQRHFGLVGMHERAQLIKSKFQIQSSPGVGTSILIIMPVDAQKNSTHFPILDDNFSKI